MARSKFQNRIPGASAWVLAGKLQVTLGLNRSEALKQAWRILRLKRQLIEGVATFTYTKVDGSTRQATGTLSNVLLNDCENIANTEITADLSNMKYYDLEANGWRCFKVANLVEVA